MATETPAKTVVKLRPKEDNHARVIKRYQDRAAQITWMAVERYLEAKADYDSVVKRRDAIDELLPPPTREQESGQVELTAEQRARYIERKRWEQFYQASYDFYRDATNFLLHVIVRWDSGYNLDAPNLHGCPRRGVIHEGFLYLALPDNEDDGLSNGQPVLHVVPMASVVDLDNLDAERDDR